MNKSAGQNDEENTMQSNIAAAINAAHAGVEAAKREGARYAIEAGQLLLEARETVSHGSWNGWVQGNTDVSLRTAQLYMRIARHVAADPANAQRVAGLSVREAARALAGPSRSPWPDAISSNAADGMVELWREADPSTRERFARDLHATGAVTREQRNAMIRTAWHEPNATKETEKAAAARLAAKLVKFVPVELLADVRRKLRECTPSDIAIAIGDVVDARRAKSQGPSGGCPPRGKRSTSGLP